MSNLTNPNASLRTSDVGLALIKRFEGFCATVYRCPAGIPTIGYGHVVKLGESFQQVTEAQATELLRTDAAIAERAVQRLISVPLTQNQFDALVSFTFNLGEGALERSSLRKIINEGRFDRVPSELNRWVFAKGKKLPGLVLRRLAEGEVFARSEAKHAAR
jgi:lysozyme